MRETIVGPGACRGLALAALLALSGLPGCARSREVGAARDSASPAPGGRFVYPLPIEPISLDFVTGTDLASSSVIRLIGDGLVDHDAVWNPVPRLAERWEWEDGGRALVFHLRQGVKFHDGIPLTSADVLFTYERAVDPKTRAVGRVESFLPVERVEAPDDRTVRVVYRRPFAPALQGWEMPILPRHLYAGKDPEGRSLQRAPVGSGPFKFVSWQSGRRILLAANCPICCNSCLLPQASSKAASILLSAGAATNPVTLSSTTSVLPPTSVTIAGRPDIIASISDSGRPSLREGSINA